MGRLEALIVNALGRSPYDDEVIEPDRSSWDYGIVQDGQQYNSKGNPINPETTRRIKEQVRASNEVLSAVGVIEETSQIRARDKAIEENLQRETEMGLRRLEIGRVILVGGVWGVCGLRRRVLLYKSYATTNILRLVSGERRQHSLLHLLGAGMPSLWGYQVVDWIGFLIRATTNGPYKEPTDQPREQGWKYWGKKAVNYIVDCGIGFAMIHYQMFAILQQLNLIPSDQYFPSNGSFIPFSRYSPLQLPPHPTSLKGLLPWGSALIDTAAPMLAILGYIRATNLISSIIFGPIYRSLPRPVNLKVVSSQNGNSQSPEQPESPNRASNQQARDSNDPSDGSVDTHRQNTLSSLEGRPPAGAHMHDSFYDEDDAYMPMSLDEQTALISLDFEATEISSVAGAPGTGDWSAELRSAEPPKQTAYRITTFTMLPPLLAAEGLSAVIAAAVTLPVEMLMVRIVANAFRASAGVRGVELVDFIESWWKLPLTGLLNVAIVQAAELICVGVIWSGYTFISNCVGGNEREWKVVSEGDDSDS